MQVREEKSYRIFNHNFHAGGGIDTLMPMTPGAMFYDYGAGRLRVFTPASVIRPEPYEALVLYLLPEERIEFAR